MLAKELIDRIESRGLLDQEIIEALREQLDQGGTRVTPEAVAKLLVDNGQLTRFQATKLIGELRSDQYPEEVEAVAVVEELGIAGEEGEVVEVVEAVVADAVEVAPVVEVAEAVPVEAQPVAVEAEPVEVAAEPVSPSERPAGRPRPQAPESQWDSFKVYGYLGIIAGLILFGSLLFFWLNAKDADDVIAQANKLYDQQNYTNAQDQYIAFLDSYGEGNQHSSISRTRIVMCELYRALTVTDTTRALALAKEKIPTIEDEEGLNEERGNLAAMLVDISDNIGNAAMADPETSGKEALLVKLDEAIEFMENPVYMPGSMRTTLSGRIKTVLETRARVDRDIKRNKGLDATVASMKSSLGAKKTKEAYDARFALLTEFPELESDERLAELIMEASKIQEGLVASSIQMPKSIEGEDESQKLRSIVLTAQNGPSLPSLRGEMFYLRAQGSVLGIDAEKGGFVWRRFVGYGQDHAPVRLEGSAGVLLSESSAFEIQRCDGATGDIRWRSKVGEDFAQPVVYRDNVYCSQLSGTVFSLNVENGEAEWATQIPQPLEVSPGVDPRTGRAYLPGNHSNVYVLDSRNGNSIQSFYLGHNKGSIAVSPVPLLGHVFVVENLSPDTSQVHILRVDEDGGNLRKAQPPITMTGNVFVQPQIVQKRRLIVLTDRGEVRVLDVEPTSEKDQVSEVAGQVASYSQPAPTQMAVGKSQMWITGTQVGRYELQINSGRVAQDWFKYKGDTFVGQPLATPDALIHARILRDTMGIRITAADPKEGTEFWQTDVGVPVAMIQKSEKGFHVVNSQGALFELTRDSLTKGVTQNPIENPGGKGVKMRFEDPVAMGNNVYALLNKAAPGQIVLYDPSREREKLRLVTLQLQPGVAPVGGALGAGGGLFTGLDNGRAVLLNYGNGQSMGNPFQPLSSPTAKVTWSSPVPVPNSDDLVVASDSRKKIYLLRVGDQVREARSADLEKAFIGRSAGVGNLLFATRSDPDSDALVGHELTTLNRTVDQKLPSRVAWGPYAAGDYCVVKTEDGQLRGFDATGRPAFAVDVPAGQNAGSPIVVDGKIVVAGVQGWIVTIDPSAGSVAGMKDIGQPIMSSPLSAGSQLLVPGREGIVYVVPMPGA